MQRTKVEKYIYEICQKTESGYVPVAKVESEKELKNKKAQAPYLEGYENCIMILSDTECATYEMDDDFYFANAKRLEPEA